jgi:putative ABC transport system ATP-binding protein
MKIPAEGMVFIVGPSGVGKSTILESMGLMSNAFVNFDTAKSIFAVNEESINPVQLWKRDEQKLTQIRERSFSFIFQSTNLMPNFSILENILIAANFSPEGYDESIVAIKSLLTEMHLSHDILARYPHEISGGQKQRVAFIRALVGEFSILLADEPTGNLDLGNSQALFKILKLHIVKSRKVAVIVTHHLELAQTYGDMIIEITPGDNGYAVPRISTLEAKKTESQIAK